MNVNAIVTLIMLGASAIACLFFPRAVVKLYRTLFGESYARLLHPIGLRALGLLCAILFCAVLFGILTEQHP